MDKYTELMVGRLDKIDESVHSIDKTLARQAEQLEIHIKRTNILEASMKPIENHVAMVSGALKLVGLIATVMGVTTGALHIYAAVKGIQ